ncbi:MAG: hypothetical protein PHS49_02350 [Candidatus Gracilibacteria bacterium]|nr:hypothetical protein [Candidatus Gracilibacteria bacterium]
MPEKTIQTKTCKHCNISFDITDKDLEFYEKVSPIFAGVKYSIPTPSLCPDCRSINRFMFRNFFNLYRRRCDATGKNIISMYRDDVSFPVYNYDIWFSDKWDPMSYGLDIVEGKEVFDYIGELHKTVPRINLMNVNSENSEYCNMSNYSNSCYLVFGNVKNDTCSYGHIVWECEKCVDCLYVYGCKNSYQCVDCYYSYNIMYSINSENCNNSYYLDSCKNCNECFGCVGLQNKQNYIFNEKYDKAEYFKIIEKLKIQTVENINHISEKLSELKKGTIVNCIIGHDNEDVTGNYIYNSKNVYNSFDVKNSENLKYSSTIGNFTNSYDVNYTAVRGELMYQTMFTLGTNCIACHNCIGESSFLYYCDSCHYCNNCFGCVGLKNKSYCIFNKQYTKQEYNEIVPKLINSMQINNTWGEYFPACFSSFCYNESIVNQYFPLTKSQSLEKGYSWSEYIHPMPNVEKIIKANQLPIDILNIPDDILNWAIECEITKKPFRIIKPELDFYRKHNLPIPKKHPDQRHADRMKLRNPRKLYDRTCDKCGIDIKTTYSPNRKELVYCESCYKKEL